MKVSRKSLAAGLIGAGVILNGAAAQAQDSGGLAGMIEDLKLPVDKKAIYYNPVLDTVLIESCAVSGADTVRCDLRTMNNYALLDHRQVNDYTLKDGVLTVGSRSKGQAEWTPDTYKFDFKPAAKAANTFQNNKMEITQTGGDDISACSIMPTESKNRAFSLCTEFNADAGTVQSYAVPTVSFQGTVVAPQGGMVGASRPFDYSYDGSHHDTLAAMLGGQNKAYFMKP